MIDTSTNKKNDNPMNSSIKNLIEKHGIYKQYDSFVLGNDNIDVINYSYHSKWHKKFNLIPTPLSSLFHENMIVDTPFKIVIGWISGYLCIASLRAENKSILKLFDNIYKVIDCPVRFCRNKCMLKLDKTTNISSLLNNKKNIVTLFNFNPSGGNTNLLSFNFVAVFNMHISLTKNMFDIGMEEKYKKFIYNKIFKILYTNDTSYDIIKKYKNVKPQHFFSFYHMDQKLIDSPLYENLQFIKDFEKLCSLTFIKNGGYDATVVSTDIRFKILDLTVRAGINLQDILRRYVDFDTTTSEGKEEYKKYLRGFLSDVSVLEREFK